MGLDARRSLGELAGATTIFGGTGATAYFLGERLSKRAGHDGIWGLQLIFDKTTQNQEMYLNLGVLATAAIFWTIVGLRVFEAIKGKR